MGRWDKGSTNYERGLARGYNDAKVEITALRAALDLFMAATSEVSGWGLWTRMDDPDLFRDIDEARIAALAIK